MSEPMYPIQQGPSVPWSVMAPHESQCQKNHSQSIQRIAQRGGFSPAEAWCVVNGINPYDQLAKGVTEKEMNQKWFDYAEKINNHYDRIHQLESEVQQRRNELVTVNVRNSQLETSLKELSDLLEKTRGNIFVDRPTLTWFDDRDLALTKAKALLEERKE